MGTTGIENLEICFVVSDGAGAFAKATGGVTGSIEFDLNRAFAERFTAKISLDGGNATDVDVIADLSLIRYSDYLVTAGFVGGEVLTLSTGAGGVAGTSTRGGDVAAITLHASSALFVADNSCKCTLNGVKGTKGAGEDFDWQSVDSVAILSPLDVSDIIGIERKY